MGRTRLRSIELAGLRIAVESTHEYDWDWPAGALSDTACSSAGADIRVGVSCGEIAPPCWDPISYAFEGGSFDVALVDEEWWVAVHAQGRRFERLARFNRSLTEGEVIVAPGMQAGLPHPLDGPMLDWLVTHAIMQRGGLVLAGSAILDSGSALAVLSVGASPVGSACEGSNWDGSVPTVTPGSRFVVSPVENDFRVYALPFGANQADATLQGDLKAIHLVDPTCRVGMNVIDSETAMDAVLSRVCVPIHAPELADKILTAVSRLVVRVPIAQVGQVEERRTALFRWGSPETDLGFAMPDDNSFKFVQQWA